MAAETIAGAVYRTPLERSAWLSEIAQADVRLKLECYQPTGSFKVRGALAALSRLDAGEQERGVVTASAGNHGLGVAFAASLCGIRATVVVPEGASPAKVAALRRLPITLLTGGPNYDVAERRAKEIARETDAVFISPYNDVWVIAGQATIGQEILEDCADLDVALVPIGGGGLISGIGSVLKERLPGVRVIGVQAESSPSMERALKAGRVVEIPVLPTLADGLAANIEPDSRTFDIAREVVDEIVLVGEEEIAAAIREAFHELHLALEGSAVVAIAALLNGKLVGLAGRRVAIVITGRNIAADTLVAILSG
jgi:threonine dehydratase